jgi:hypothetical protein
MKLGNINIIRILKKENIIKIKSDNKKTEN